MATAFMLVGCVAPLTTYHENCMNQPLPFADQVACVKQQITAEGASGYDKGLVSEYLQTGNVLVRKVELGEISEEEARLEFISKLNDVRARDTQMRAQQAAINDYYDRQFPRYTDCVPDSNGGLQCRTF